jgi:hypothetical protein
MSHRENPDHLLEIKPENIKSVYDQLFIRSLGLSTKINQVDTVLSDEELVEMISKIERISNNEARGVLGLPPVSVEIRDGIVQLEQAVRLEVKNRVASSNFPGIIKALKKALEKK